MPVQNVRKLNLVIRSLLIKINMAGDISGIE